MMMSSAQPSMAGDRRRYQRKAGGDDQGYFLVAGMPAKLVDWSFGGIGVLPGESLGLGAGDAVELRIYDPGQEIWETLPGLIRRVDSDGSLGIAFADDGENTVRILIHLLSNRLARTLS